MIEASSNEAVLSEDAALPRAAYEFTAPDVPRAGAREEVPIGTLGASPFVRG